MKPTYVRSVSNHISNLAPWVMGLLITMNVPSIICTQAFGAIANGGFDTGDFAGWNVYQNPAYRVITDFPPPGLPVNTFTPVNVGILGIQTGPHTALDMSFPFLVNLEPIDGNSYASLTVRHDPSLFVSSPPLVNIYQSVVLHAGQILSGSAAFATEEYLAPPGGDTVFVRIKDQFGNIIATPFSFSSGTDIRPGNSTAWMNWQWEATSDAMFTIELGLVTGDAQFSSTAYFDAVRVSPDVAPVPEPSTYLAGVLLIVPFGSSTLRYLRNRKSA
jgi:hypothetical protein